MNLTGGWMLNPRSSSQASDYMGDSDVPLTYHSLWWARHMGHRAGGKSIWRHLWSSLALVCYWEHSQLKAHGIPA